MATNMDRIMEKLDEIQADVSRLALAQATAHEVLRAHIKQANGRTIHHQPPCESLEEHKSEHRRESKLYMAILGLIISASALAFSVVSAIMK